MQKFIITLLFVTQAFVTKAQYIAQVLEYKPAPGQFVNSKPWGVPEAAKSLIGGVTGSMSLGAFGGYIIFKFDKPVVNNPDNPFGVDFTIFGNPLVDWSEPGVVWVMKDENGNRLPDDTWYELAGSDYFFTSTIKNYEVTYTNPAQATAANVPWTDNQGNTGIVYANSFHSQSYYPLADSFPEVNAVQYTLKGTRIADVVDSTVKTYVKSYKRAFGYVDNQLRGAAPYTIPDNPYTLQKENSGGDAFDINWAVDATGNYVNLDKIDFIKVQNGVLANAGWLGEISTELTGAVVVAPNTSITGITDMVVMKDLPDTIKGTSFQIEAFAYYKGRCAKNEALNWTANMTEATVNTSGLLTFSKPGRLIITASLAGNADISKTDSTILVYTDIPITSIFANSSKALTIYPNPASSQLRIAGVVNASVSIMNLSGQVVFSCNSYSNEKSIDVSNWNNGLYVVQVKESGSQTFLKFFKQ